MSHRTPSRIGRRGTTLIAAGVAILVVLGLGGAALALRWGGQSPASAARTTSAAPSPPARSPKPAVAPNPQQGQCSPAAAIAAMPLRDRLAQLLIVGVGPSDALSVVRSEQVGGIFITGAGNTLLTGGTVARIQQAAQIPVFVAVDAEGGRVQLDGLGGHIPSARRMAATMTPHEVYQLALRRGRELAQRGVTMNFAPVLDVSSQPDNAVIGDRSFSSDPQVVAEYAAAFARGMRDAGILPVFKHFPGHGRASGDSHLEPVTTPPLSELREVDLVPYRQLLGHGRAAVMLGHLQVPGLTESGLPASLSPAAVSLLREELGFDGLIITDDLFAMDAIRDRYTVAQAARAALAAGVDMALMISADRLDAVLDHLEAAVAGGSLPEAEVNDSVARVLAAKNVDPCAIK